MWMSVSWTNLVRMALNVKTLKEVTSARVWVTGSLENTVMKVRKFHLNCSLRVAVPTPRGRTGGRERLRKTDTNRVLWCHVPSLPFFLGGWVRLHVGYLNCGFGWKSWTQITCRKNDWKKRILQTKACKGTKAIIANERSFKWPIKTQRQIPHAQNT